MSEVSTPVRSPASGKLAKDKSREKKSIIKQSKSRRHSHKKSRPSKAKSDNNTGGSVELMHGNPSKFY